ncbi:MAG: Na/Pi cotransporter family protein [Bacillota bacterium]|nr:Na/Pi cotransporter family protein [Bacillota bacterium]
MGTVLWLLARIIGGVGVFLYGMNLMSLSLEKTAGSRMKGIVESCTRNRVFAAGAGAAVTMIIQSSSAATVMTVGFVNAGIMTLSQAAGVIIGANVGTTVTAQIVAFNLDAAAPVIAGLGAAGYLMFRNDRNKNIAQIFVGFGLLFTGIVFLKDAMGFMGENPRIMGIIAEFDGRRPLSYFVLVIAGILVTVLVQSSSTVTGLLAAMASQNLLTIYMAVPLILGSNLGTTCTALISAAGAGRNAKRAAWIHVIFNGTGVILFAVFLQNIVVDAVVGMSANDLPRQIANFHTAFNLITAVVSLPFINLLVRAAVRILPVREDEKYDTESILDPRMLETPPIAIKQVREELYELTCLASENYADGVGLLTDFSPEIFVKVENKEKRINDIHNEIKEYLKRITEKEVSAHERREINVLFSIDNDMERMADNAFNIAEAARYKFEQGIEFSETAVRDMKELHSLVMDSCEDILRGVTELSGVYAGDIIAREYLIDTLEREFRERHMSRLNRGECSAGAGMIYLESIGYIERAADRIRKAAMVISDFKNNN